MTRALIITRLSRLTDASTSTERQREACEELCRARGWEVVGVAEDLDVSAGKTSPFERPALASWLKRHDEFQTIVFFRLDRLVRSVAHLWRMIEWANEHNVALVSATEKHFDLSDKFGMAIVSLIATVAELELDALSERNRSAAQHNLKAGKWRGGTVPFGYRPEKIDGDWRLVPDEVMAPIANEVARRVLEGEPLRRVAHDLNQRGVPTQKDRMSELAKKPKRDFKWHSAGLKRAMESQTLLGRVVVRDRLIKDGSPVVENGRPQYGPEKVLTDDSHRPLVRAQPLLEVDVFERVQKALKDRENRKEPTKRSTSLLVGVVKCGVCERNMYYLKPARGRKEARYRCASAQYKSTCGNKTVKAAWLESWVTESMLEELGEAERLDKIWDPGEDHTQELAAVDAQLRDFAQLLVNPDFGPGTPQRTEVLRFINEHNKRRAELGAIRSRPAGYVYHKSGELFKDYWLRLDNADRNLYLRDCKVSITVTIAQNADDYQVFIDYNSGDLALLTKGFDVTGTLAESYIKMLQSGHPLPLAPKHHSA